MTDTPLLDRPAPPQRLSLPQQAVLNLAAQWALEIVAENRAPIETSLRAILPAACSNVPQAFDPVLQAADHIADCAARALPRDHRDWWDAQLRVNRALLCLFGQRAVAAWRAHEETLVIDPTEDLAHAQP